ncbi:hypothetical protein AAHH78_42350, partial [Burkholderia pseudomallei]
MESQRRRLCYKSGLTAARRRGTLSDETAMYVIDIRYSAPLERIDDALERHRASLRRLFDGGVFV